MARLDAVVAWRGTDRRYLAACLLGAVVSGAAAGAVVAGQVPLDVVPASGLVAGVCAVLAVEWLFAAGLVAVLSEHAHEAPAPGLTVGPGPARVPPAGLAVEAARVEPGPQIAALQDRIGYLTAALTLAAAAEDLHQVGVIAQDALTADLRRAGGEADNPL